MRLFAEPALTTLRTQRRDETTVDNSIKCLTATEKPTTAHNRTSPSPFTPLRPRKFPRKYSTTKQHRYYFALIRRICAFAPGRPPVTGTRIRKLLCLLARSHSQCIIDLLEKRRVSRCIYRLRREKHAKVLIWRTYRGSATHMTRLADSCSRRTEDCMNV